MLLQAGQRIKVSNKVSEDIFNLDAGPLCKDSSIGFDDGGLRNLSNTNMFSFFSQKQEQMERQADILNEREKLESQLDRSNMNFSFMSSLSGSSSNNSALKSNLSSRNTDGSSQTEGQNSFLHSAYAATLLNSTSLCNHY